MQGESKTASGVIPAEHMKFILRQIREINFGQLVLVAQDGKLVQIEKSEKIRTAGMTGQDGSAAPRKNWDEKKLSEHIQQEFSRLIFGRLTIVVQNHTAVQLGRTENWRFTGMDGEGI